jgi:hypothetical protein|tara:strand:- start:10 stop:153 length:144 start_codon:yes stop_codon:yes gene_type:complete
MDEEDEFDFQIKLLMIGDSGACTRRGAARLIFSLCAPSAFLGELPRG